MCGIVAYTGSKNCTEILLEGLKRLEYMGYDSWGFAFVKGKDLVSVKKAGKVSEAKNLIDNFPQNSFLGIAHTRWATHGAPTNMNAHPHLDCKLKIAIVHNGIIEKIVTISLHPVLGFQHMSFRIGHVNSCG